MKKTAFLLLLAAAWLLSPGCTKEKRFGIAELSRRLAAHEEAYAFAVPDALLSDGYYHIAYSLESEDDLLLSLCEDADGRLTRVLLTASQENAPAEEFCAFAAVLTAVFCDVSDREAREMAQEAGLHDKNDLFTDQKGTAARKRYSYTFFSTPLSVTVLLTVV